MTFEKTGAANRFAYHDIELAMGNLIVQATDLGLAVRIIGGFDANKARDLLLSPPDTNPSQPLLLDIPALPNQTQIQTLLKNTQKNALENLHPPFSLETSGD